MIRQIHNFYYTGLIIPYGYDWTDPPPQSAPYQCGCLKPRLLPLPLMFSNPWDMIGSKLGNIQNVRKTEWQMTAEREAGTGMTRG